MDSKLTEPFYLENIFKQVRKNCFYIFKMSKYENAISDKFNRF